VDSVHEKIHIHKETESTMLSFNDAFPLLLNLADGIHPTFYGARQGNEIEAYVKAITIGVTHGLQTKD
jgi:hypothetical protein